MIDINVLWGIILVSVSLKCWIGQTIIALSPQLASTIRIMDKESELDTTFFADMRGQAIWDAFTLWLLPVAGSLLIVNHAVWPYFGLIGGSIYLYFVGRNMVTRVLLHRHGISIGRSPRKVMIYLFLWGIIACITIIFALQTLYR